MREDRLICALSITLSRAVAAERDELYACPAADLARFEHHVNLSWIWHRTPRSPFFND